MVRNWDSFGLVLGVLALTLISAAQAQSTRKLTKDPTVRFCPSRCVVVTGHGFANGSSVAVFETRGGWARISDYLDRKQLTASFGDKITKRPALWVPLAALDGNAAKAEAQPTKKKSRTRRVNVVRRLARLRNPPVPTYRPGTAFAADPGDVVDVEKVAAKATGENEVEKQESAVAESEVQPTDAQKVAEKERIEEAEKTRLASEAAAREKEDAEALAAAQKAEAAKNKQDEEALAAAKREEEALAAAKREEEKEAEIARQEAEKVAKAAKAKRDADAAEAEARKLAKAEAAKTRKAEEEKLAEAEKVKKEQQEARDKAEAAKAAEMKKAAEAEKAAAEAKKAAAEAKKAAETPEQENVEVAKVDPSATASTEPETVYESANPNPIELAERPKKYTKALNDKRLSKLPGQKSKRASAEEVIAVRHFALMLLVNNECSGIADGGRSPGSPGMLFVRCTDDPEYLRQFPLEEESW